VWVDRFVTLRAERGDGVGIAGVSGSEQFLGLTLQLYDIGPHG
jgi:hypothetical protein